MINTFLRRLSDFIITVVVSDFFLSSWERVPDIFTSVKLLHLRLKYNIKAILLVSVWMGMLYLILNR